MSPIIGLSAKPWPEKPAATSKAVDAGHRAHHGQVVRREGFEAGPAPRQRAGANRWEDRARRLEARLHALLQHLVAIARVVGDRARASRRRSGTRRRRAASGSAGGRRRPAPARSAGAARLGEQHLERARLDRQARGRPPRGASRSTRPPPRSPRRRPRAPVVALAPHQRARPRPRARAPRRPPRPARPSRRAARAKARTSRARPRPGRRSRVHPAEAALGAIPGASARAACASTISTGTPSARCSRHPGPHRAPRARRRAPAAGHRCAGSRSAPPARDRARASARGSRARAPARRGRGPSPARRPRWPRRRQRPRGRARAR